MFLHFIMKKENFAQIYGDLAYNLRALIEK